MTMDFFQTIQNAIGFMRAYAIDKRFAQDSFDIDEDLLNGLIRLNVAALDMIEALGVNREDFLSATFKAAEKMRMEDGELL